jgi:NAD dependent epimerase/dehydratase family enzyme
MRRWYAMRVPQWAIRLALGDAGDAMLLSSQRILPARLLDDGFEFRHRKAEEAIDALGWP